MSVRKVLVTGAAGQLGQALSSLAPDHLEIIAYDRQTLNITNAAQVEQCLDGHRPEVVINTAAYTAVDKAEDEPELAIRLNTEASVVMSKAMKALGGCLVHYSTDYVFDGSGTHPWNETDEVGPLNLYGASKLAGEEAIQASGCQHLIFRTSWVYASRGNNFAKTMLRLAKERDTLNVINDQIGAPTGADLIADVTAHALRQWQQQPCRRQQVLQRLQQAEADHRDTKSDGVEQRQRRTHNGRRRVSRTQC